MRSPVPACIGARQSAQHRSRLARLAMECLPAIAPGWAKPSTRRRHNRRGRMAPRLHSQQTAPTRSLLSLSTGCVHPPALEVLHDIILLVAPHACSAGQGRGLAKLKAGLSRSSPICDQPLAARGQQNGGAGGGSPAAGPSHAHAHECVHAWATSQSLPEASQSSDTTERIFRSPLTSILNTSGSGTSTLRQHVGGPSSQPQKPPPRQTQFDS